MANAEGLPFTVQVAGLPFQDEVVLRVMEMIETHVRSRVQAPPAPVPRATRCIDACECCHSVRSNPDAGSQHNTWHDFPQVPFAVGSGTRYYPYYPTDTA